ncbi:hypothetical protein V5O48_001077 [Marasmius crinis-equi]|uniref:DUF2207 domain-containing protein n=1 Tax=Marasmius crinis-equi TaxID=585013 RepID=A0ABR3FZI8_9AGAR
MFLRRTLLRLLKLTAYAIPTWIIFAILYATLPSPVPDDASIISSLQNGQTVVRVFDKDAFFSPFDATPSVEVSRQWTGESFIIEFKLVQEPSGSQSLMFGPGYDLLEDVDAFLFYISREDEPWETQVPYHNLSIKAFEKEEQVSLSSHVSLTLPVANTDGIRHLPAAPADAALLAWWIKHYSGHMWFRIRRVPEKRLIEIWPDSFFWYSDEGLEGSPTFYDIEPIISIKLDESGNPVEFSFPPAPSSSSPSAFHPIRVGLLCLVNPFGPFGQVSFFVITLLLQRAHKIAASGIFCFVIYGIYRWIKHGRSLPISDKSRVADSVRARKAEDIDLEANAATGIRPDGQASKEHSVRP